MARHGVPGLGGTILAMKRPLIAITCDVEGSGPAIAPKIVPSFANYLRAVIVAGADPVPIGAWRAMRDGGLDQAVIEADARAFAGFVFTGGRDPDMASFGCETHPVAAAKLMHPLRQAYEVALLRELLALGAAAPPVLGVCLGCQLMALAAGGSLVQHLPDTIGSAAGAHTVDTDADAIHEVKPILGAALAAGRVASHHHQAIADPGDCRVIAHAPDGVIEAIDLVDRPDWLGVQWHPERTDDPALGQALFDRLVAAARQRA